MCTHIAIVVGLLIIVLSSNTLSIIRSVKCQHSVYRRWIKGRRRPMFLWETGQIQKKYVAARLLYLAAADIFFMTIMQCPASWVLACRSRGWGAIKACRGCKWDRMMIAIPWKTDYHWSLPETSQMMRRLSRLAWSIWFNAIVFTRSRRREASDSDVSPPCLESQGCQSWTHLSGYYLLSCSSAKSCRSFYLIL